MKIRCNYYIIRCIISKKFFNLKIAASLNHSFSLVEILIAMLFLCLVIFSYLLLNHYSARGTMDAYYEFLATSLVEEVFTIFQAGGYDFVKKYGSEIPFLPDLELNTWQQISPNFNLNNKSYDRPSEVSMLERYVSLEEIKGNDIDGYKITVKIRPVTSSRIAAYLVRNIIELSTIIFKNTEP